MVEPDVEHAEAIYLFRRLSRKSERRRDNRRRKADQESSSMRHVIIPRV